MAVPCGDERDHKFARHFNIPITNIIGSNYNGDEANPTKDAVLDNSDFLNGIKMRDAIDIVIGKLETMGIGTRKVNYKMRDAAFSRQRYWGEPFPIKWVEGRAIPLPESELPLQLPQVNSYQPGPNGEGPLANISDWTERQLETNTMPGYAGSSWYFLRYMDPGNDKEFCSRQASDYWGQVDLYIGGTEHAVGHLLYSRMWTKALYDLNLISHDEPFKRLVNQGMIQGSSRFVYRLSLDPLYLEERDFLTVNNILVFVSVGIVNRVKDNDHSAIKIIVDFIRENYPYVNWDFLNGNWVAIQFSQIHADVNIVDGVELAIDSFQQWRSEYSSAKFILEEGKYICGTEVEKMSKSKYNTVNPDDLVARYGADTFRMYEMFLGPVEMSKPWDTKGIEGVHRFLKKLWRLFFDENKGKLWTEDAPTAAELKLLHKTIKKIEEDTERFSFNTGVSGFMIAVNELGDLKCHKRAILEPLLILLTPYAPHISEELWHQLGNESSILDAAYPVFDPALIAESEKEYPVSINGKTRTTLVLPLDATQQLVEEQVLANEVVQKWLEGRAPKKIIYVKGRMINVVV
jgi:leucyl-tRNA synthetase